MSTLLNYTTLILLTVTVTGGMDDAGAKMGSRGDPMSSAYGGADVMEIDQGSGQNNDYYGRK